jgi:2-oxoglutarate ferredoxin oxidoreductase subunit alpha
MTATSGGGFCLMTEALGLAAIVETPIVLVIGQRPGPSTGMATYTSQGDLLFTIRASHGEFQRIVLAPGDVDECFYLTAQAFNLAEKFQVPSIILCDKYLLESHKSTAVFDEDRVKIDRGQLLEMNEWKSEIAYERYKVTEDGVSPRILVGTKGATTLSNSNEHYEYGYSTVDTEPVLKMVEKRFRKEKHLRNEIRRIEPLKIYGPEKPELTLIGWGSTKGPALEALRMLQKDGIETGFCQIRVLEPFPDEELNIVLNRGERFLLCEMNRTAQLGKLIKLNNGFTCENPLLRFDGRPFNPDEIYSNAKEVLE